MRYALTLAIGGGFVFYEDDFGEPLDRFRCAYWIGESSEWCYALAVAVGNKTAIAAYEKYANRTPIIADDVDPGSGWSAHAGYLHLSGTRQRERLAVGFSFLWKGEIVKVTSLVNSGGITEAICCSYTPTDYVDCKTCHHYTIHSGGKLLHRYRVTAKAIKAIQEDRAERKEREKLLQELTELARKDRAVAITDALGVKTRADYNRLPLKKIRKVLEAEKKRQGK